jgi:hypothetical protein
MAGGDTGRVTGNWLLQVVDARIRNQ